MLRFDLYKLPRAYKRLICFATDVFLVPLSLYAANALRYGSAAPDLDNRVLLFLIVTLIGAGLIGFFKLHQIKLHAFENRAMMQIGLVAMLLSMVTML